MAQTSRIAATIRLDAEGRRRSIAGSLIPPLSIEQRIPTFVGYQGDGARLYVGPKLLVDNFFNGETWSVGLKRFLDPQRADTFNLEILSLRGDAPVYLEAAKKPAIPAGGQIDILDSVRLTPEYQLTITLR